VTVHLNCEGIALSVFAQMTLVCEDAQPRVMAHDGAVHPPIADSVGSYHDG